MRIGGMFPDQLAFHDPGHVAFNVLRVASNVASAETVVIGADTYEIEIVNTDSTDNTQGGDFNNTTDPLVVVDAVLNYTNITFTVGKLIRIENEILVVTDVTGNDVTFARGVSGTTTATHIDTLDIFEGDGITGDIAVGLVAILTPTAFTPALVDDINSRGTEPMMATQFSVNEIMISKASIPGGNPIANGSDTAVSETLGGVNNAWDKANIDGGEQPHGHDVCIRKRIPTAQEVALGNLHVVCPLDIITVSALEVTVTANNVKKSWDGGYSLSDNILTINNDGTTDWAETDTITVTIIVGDGAV